MKSSKDTGFTRREFLKVAGVTAAGVVATSLAASPAFSVVPARVIGANDRIRVGFIGVGGQGVRHLQSVMSMAESNNVQAVGVCDVWEKKRQEAQKIAGLPANKVYGDYRKMLEDKDIDAVLIGTPEHWHAKIATDALESGRSCYIEKPVTRHLSESIALLGVAKRTKGIVQVGSQGTSAAIWTRANQLIKEGKIGTTVWTQGSYCRNSKEGEWNIPPIDPTATTATVDWKMWLGACKNRPWDPERYFHWRKYLDYSSGIISDLFPHRLHPLMLAMGPEYPKRVSCIGTTLVQKDREVADNTQMLVEFPSGATMVIAGSTINQTGLPDVIHGNKATMSLGGNRIDVKVEVPYSEDMDGVQENVEGPPGSMGDHWKNFFEAMRTGKKCNCDIELATKVQVIVSLAEMSWLQGKTMNFDPVKLRVV